MLRGRSGGDFRLGGWLVQPAQCRLSKDGRTVQVRAKVMDLLAYLASRQGEVVSKDDLLNDVWGSLAVSESALTRTVTELRHALGDDADHPHLLETIAKRGYRLIGEVEYLETRAGGSPTAPMAPDDGAAGAGDSAPDVRAAALPVGASAARRMARAHGSLALVALVALASAAFLWRSRADSSKAGSGTFVWTTASPLTSFHGSEGAPSFSPDGSQVAFHWNGSSQDNIDVYVAGVGGGEPIRVTTDEVPEGWPAWSPDGRRLAFLRPGARDWEVVVMPALGGTPRLVGRVNPLGLALPFDTHFAHVSGVRLVSWTPDGRWLAVGGVIEGKRGLWLFEADGPGRRQLTDTTQNHSGPAFSADGRRVAFVRHQRGGREGVLHILPLGEDLQPSGPPVALVSAAPLDVISAAWEPGGRSLVYTVGSHHTGSRLWRVRLDADRLSIVGRPELLAVGDQATGLDVAPTGRLVYVAHFRDTGLWRLDLTQPDRGLSATNLPDSTFDELGPAYSPDGTKLMFVSTRSGTEELWIADADGSNVRQMTSLRWCLGEPRWSPDGTRVAFTVDHGGRPDVYLLDVRTGEVKPLTSTPELEYAPHWSPDGAWIYFGRGPIIQDVEMHRVPSSGGPSVRVTRGSGVPAHDGRSVFVFRAMPVSEPSSTGTTAPRFSSSWRTLWQVPLDGGEPRRLAERVDWGSIAAGRRAVYFVSLNSPRESSIEEVEIASGRQRRLATLSMRPARGTALSPDERTLIVSAINAIGANLMVVEPHH